MKDPKLVSEQLIDISDELATILKDTENATNDNLDSFNNLPNVRSAIQSARSEATQMGCLKSLVEIAERLGAKDRNAGSTARLKKCVKSLTNVAKQLGAKNKDRKQ